jgi:LmbE family N-acetylglucosaminyl deacetylase
MFSFSKSDKVLVVAPHPDDESLATGGLLQRIFAQKIPVRIVFATDGENNPWAQRYWEKRWKIGPNERARWGRRRREEALDAIRTLGGKPDCARFLNLPDLGTTDLLMHGSPDLSALIAEEIRDWSPTVALIPTLHDAHPDHSALSVAFSIALGSFGGLPIRIWAYLVHAPAVSLPYESVKLLLSSEEVACKRRAILCHATQVALSRRRFTSFAKVEESYYPHHPVDAKTPVERPALARLHEGVLNLQFEASQRERFRSKILFAFSSGTENEHRWMLPVSFRSGNAQIWDMLSNRPLHDAMIQWTGSKLSVDIPLPGTLDCRMIYAKLSGWTVVFDRSGWSQFIVPVSREKSAIRQANIPRLATLL